MEVSLTEIDPDIIVLTEHNMNNYDMERFNLDNYKKIAHYSRTTTTGGGVLILSKESIKGKPLLLKMGEELCQDKLLEFCCVKFKVDNFHFLLVGIYRTPQFENSEFLNRLNKLINNLVRKEKNLIIIGDFNIDTLKDSPELKELKSILLRCGMNYIIDFPTRVTNTSKTCIDNILTNINKDQIKTEGIVTALSDHDGQLMELLTCPKKIDNTTLNYWGRNFSVDNMKLFKSLLEKENWLTLFNSNIESKYDTFHNIFQYYFNLSFPKVRKKIYKHQNSKNWITENLKKNKNDLIELNNLVKESGSEVLKTQLKEKTQQYKLNVMSAKRNYYSDKVKNSENISKTVWEIINKETRKTPANLQQNHVLKLGNCEISNPLHVANSFNNFFVSIIENMLDDRSNQAVGSMKESNKQIPTFRCPPIDESDLNKIIDALKNKWSSGFDEVPIKIIKYAKESLLKPLKHIINSSFISGIFPKQLKISKVIPVYKKGEESDIQNYRPISILPSISKIFEKAIQLNLIRHLELYDLFNHEQHGFRKNKSTTTALISFVESIIESLDKQEKVTEIFMD